MLSELKANADHAKEAFEAAAYVVYAGGIWDFYRECERCEGNVSPSLLMLYDAYISALHAFYLARDGERGVLGSRGI